MVCSSVDPSTGVDTRAAQPGTLFILSGPSGAGKGTLLAGVTEIVPNTWFSVSATTRPARPGEVDGVDYHFVTRDQFEAWIANDGLLEWAEVYGNYYGTPRDPVETEVAAGKLVLLDIDTQGAFQVMEKVPEAVSIFIEPPSLEVLRQRLRGRGTEDEAQLQIRLEAASREIARKVRYTYTLVNNDVETSVAELAALLQQERYRSAL